MFLDTEICCAGHVGIKLVADCSTSTAVTRKAIVLPVVSIQASVILMARHLFCALGTQARAEIPHKSGVTASATRTGFNTIGAP